MTISFRLNDADALLFKNYAQMRGISVSDLVRESVTQRIEDEYDLAAYEKAMASHQKNPVTYSLDQVEKELGLL